MRYSYMTIGQQVNHRTNLDFCEIYRNSWNSKAFLHLLNAYQDFFTKLVYRV